MVKNLLISNLPTIIILVIFAAYILYHIVTKQWTELRSVAYKIMLAAEKTFSSGQGKEKFDFVFNQVYNLLPAWLKLFIPPDTLRLKLQGWYSKIIDYLDNGKIDSSVQPPAAQA